MRKVLSRIDKLEKTNKCTLIEIENKMQREAQREQSFHSLNLVMKQHFPKHAWCQLTNRERLKIYNNPEPHGTYKKTDSPLPIFVFSNKKEHRLFIEVHRLYSDIIRKEILRRRKLK